MRAVCAAFPKGLIHKGCCQNYNVLQQSYNKICIAEILAQKGHSPPANSGCIGGGRPRCEAMTEPPKGPILNQHVVGIAIDGRIVSGTYSTSAGMITVTALHGSKTTQIGSMPPYYLAKVMLRKLVRDGKA